MNRDKGTRSFKVNARYEMNFLKWNEVLETLSVDGLLQRICFQQRWSKLHCILASSFIMMTSSSNDGNIFRVTGHLGGNSPVHGEFPAQRPVTRSFDVFFDLRPNRRLSKQWWGWWFETPSSPLRRHCNDWVIHVHSIWTSLQPFLLMA